MTDPTKPLHFAAKEVPRHVAPSPDQFRQAPPESPVILTGAMNEFPLLTRLKDRSTEAQIGELAALFGDAPVSYTTIPGAAQGHIGKRDEHGYEVHVGARADDVPFSEFARKLHASTKESQGERIYMTSMTTGGWPDFASLCPTRFSGPQAMPRLWIGAGGHVSNLHYDWALNVLYLLAGKKRVVLFPPDCLPYLYPAPGDRLLNGAMASLVNVLEPDTARFPNFEKALQKAQVALLGPGDMLFIPPTWWHHVESFGLNVMVNTFVEDVVRFDEVLALYVSVAAAFDGLPLRMLSLWRDFFRFYVFRLPYEPIFREEASPRYIPRMADLERITKVAAEATIAVQAYPLRWRTYVAEVFDYFVFQVHGEPYPTLPPGTREEELRALAIKQLVLGVT